MIIIPNPTKRHFTSSFQAWKRKRLLAFTPLTLVFVFFVMYATADCADPVQLPGRGVVFGLVALDQTVKTPLKSGTPDQSQVLEGWDFTKTAFSDGAFVLRMSNVSNTPATFSFIDTWEVVVVAPDGHPLQQKGGRDGTFPPTRCHFRGARPSETVNFLISFKLSYDKEGRLVLWGDDGLGGFWACGPVAPGKYRIHVEYGFNPASGNTIWHKLAEEKLGIKTSSLWTGDGKTNEVEFEVQ